MRTCRLLVVIMAFAIVLFPPILHAQSGGTDPGAGSDENVSRPGRGTGMGPGMGMGRGRGMGMGPGMGRGMGMGMGRGMGMGGDPSAMLGSLIMKALDSDSDGELSPREIRNAVAALKALDLDKNGTLTSSELTAIMHSAGDESAAHDESNEHDHQGMGNMPADMSTLHSMFADRNKIHRTVKNLPDGAVAVTESDDEQIAALIQDHVPNMERRVQSNEPLPPMTFHPIFVELIKNAEKYTLEYEDTLNGVKVTYRSDDPFVVQLVQEHAALVSRFIKNGMEEIHKPYQFPKNMQAASSIPQ
ncbi:MAG: hypothetical protein KDB03_09765 [Planctomycetales bacterium]|nr:hypothetical protein [Planctomycetales bacterium]